ncbi:hypothetical protein PPTG_22654 [Phytophthora nicotianae INRA-310]|uniref:Uncharacterized protein n=1 Tax=Phytophthora nicotianae (strain INRA-310) TaxID=761204 RepID=W2QDE9_PHYN3|nr:hypothetical protein PPTG_22654 [Phytophthora nicotianae INRA-310]ETN11197.1 hypothetical protein PPTG_22654 [Phytophthora nicotianae INRA-310]
MDPKMCALLKLAVYIEATSNMAISEYLYGNPKDGDRNVRRFFLTDMVGNEVFKKLKPGNLGTHSLPVGELAKTGISCVTPDLFCNEIAPTVKQLMGDSIAEMLALTLLWAAIEPVDAYEYALLPSKLNSEL